MNAVSSLWCGIAVFSSGQITQTWLSQNSSMKENQFLSSATFLAHACSQRQKTTVFSSVPNAHNKRMHVSHAMARIFQMKRTERSGTSAQQPTRSWLRRRFLEKVSDKGIVVGFATLAPQRRKRRGKQTQLNVFSLRRVPEQHRRSRTQLLSSSWSISRSQHLSLVRPGCSQLRNAHLRLAAGSRGNNASAS